RRSGAATGRLQQASVKAQPPPDPAHVARDVLEKARQRLEGPLRTLQTLAHPRLELAQATECIADASSALYDAEQHLARESRDSQATLSLRLAMEALGKALQLVETAAGEDPLPRAAAESVALALALLYPVAQARLRRRRAVMLQESSATDAPLAYVPQAPEPPPNRPSSMAAGASSRRNRRSTPRTLLEVDIGLLSQSHFYTGLSMDLSKGGVFVATYDPLPPGALVTLFFQLPTGAIEAAGIVRWTRP